MKHVHKSVLLWYSPQEMYDLVTAVEAYPAFLPWCSSATVLQQHADGVTAKLGLSYMGLKQSFTTRNRQTPGQALAMQLVDGPFSALEGHWQFLPLGQPGASGATQAACKVEFDLQYAFAGGALNALISPVFDKIANTFVDAFVKRAEQVYGAR